MKWELKPPKYGDMIRVNLGKLYHYGIFASEDEVIQFGPPPVSRTLVNGGDIRVCTTDVRGFLCGGFLEVAVPERKERKKRRSPDDTVAAARGRLGEGGYNILYNNCEHFAYECAIGESYSSQTEAMRTAWRSIPVLDVYVARLPEVCDLDGVFPPERREEIESCKNQSVRAQKYAVWKLLEYGIRRTFGRAMDSLEFTRTAEGKWHCDACEFSLSHSGNAVVVALSRSPVGVDIEATNAVRPELAKKILTEEEYACYCSLGAGREEYLSRKWTEKESLFKQLGGKSFIPSAITVEGKKLRTEKVTVDGVEYLLTVASDDTDRFKLFSDVKL